MLARQLGLIKFDAELELIPNWESYQMRTSGVSNNFFWSDDIKQDLHWLFTHTFSKLRCIFKELTYFGFDKALFAHFFHFYHICIIYHNVLFITYLDLLKPYSQTLFTHFFSKVLWIFKSWPCYVIQTTYQNKLLKMQPNAEKAHINS